MALSKCGMDNLDETAQEKKSHGDYGFPVAVYRDLLEEEEVVWHWHIEFELILVTEGEGQFSCNGISRKIKAGQGIFVNSGNLHSCSDGPSGHCELHSIVFHPRLVSGGTDSVFWDRYLKPLTENKGFGFCFMTGETDWESRILELIDSTWKRVRDEEDGFEFSVRDGLSEIMFALYKNMPDAGNDSNNSDIRKIARVKSMMEFIQNNYTEEILTGDIAASAAISESECQRCFKAVLHTTPVKYLLDIRMQRACELLTNTSLTVNNVAEFSGFKDNSYFGKIFRKETGMTPLEYRGSARG